MGDAVPNLESVYQGIHTLYNDPVPAAKEKAGKWLEQVQKSVRIPRRFAASPCLMQLPMLIALVGTVAPPSLRIAIIHFSLSLCRLCCGSNQHSEDTNTRLMLCPNHAHLFPSHLPPPCHPLTRTTAHPEVDPFQANLIISLSRSHPISTLRSTRGRSPTRSCRRSATSSRAALPR